MRWLLAGIAFALAVGLAIGTAAIRADNTRCRCEIERRVRAIRDLEIEQQRLQMLVRQRATPAALAAALRRELEHRPTGEVAAQ